MATRKSFGKAEHIPVAKRTSQGTGGRGRTVKISTSAMNKNKKRAHKKYRGQGR